MHMFPFILALFLAYGATFFVIGCIIAVFRIMFGG